MTKEEKLTEEINFADQGAGSYLCCSLWDMMEDHNATLEDFEHNTKTWRVAVELSACEEYEYTPYKDLWEKIICTSFVERQEHNSTAQETAENIREYLLNKVERFLDKAVTEYSDHLKGEMKTKQSVLLHCLLTSGHELSIRDMCFDDLTSDGLVFNSEGRIEQGCGKEDCCQTELAL
jgi:hypothetical protein